MTLMDNCCSESMEEEEAVKWSLNKRVRMCMWFFCCCCFFVFYSVCSCGWEALIQIPKVLFINKIYQWQFSLKKKRNQSFNIFFISKSNSSDFLFLLFLKVIYNILSSKLHQITRNKRTKDRKKKTTATAIPTQPSPQQQHWLVSPY